MKKEERDNSNLVGLYSDSLARSKDDFEHVSAEELSYIKEKRSSIISSRKWYSLDKGSTNNAPFSHGNGRPDPTLTPSTSHHDALELNENVASTKTKNLKASPSGNTCKKIYNRQALLCLILLQHQTGLPPSAFTRKIALSNLSEDLLERDYLTDTTAETVVHSQDLKNIFQEVSSLLVSDSNLESEDFAVHDFSDDKDAPPDEPEEYYFDDLEDDENGFSLLSSDRENDDDIESLDLTIIDADSAGQEELEENYYLDTESAPLDDSSISPVIDWLVIDADEFEDELSQYEDLEIETDGKVSRHDRAFQVALSIGKEFELERHEIEFLSEVFYERGWSATKTSILEALSNNATIEEIRLAYEVKILWQEHSEYASGYLKQYDILSWPTALFIIRSFGAYPDIAEVESLLLHLYECWEGNLTLQRTFRVFGQYVYYRFGRVDRTLDIMPYWTFEADSLISHDWLTPPSSLDIPDLTEFRAERQLDKIRLRYAEN